MSHVEMRETRLSKEGQVVGYRKLVVWQKADELAMAVYDATRGFPSEERYGLTAQLRRAALSVPTNLAEGASRQGKKELKQFVNMALGSLAEVDYLIGFSYRLGYLTQEGYDGLDGKRRHVGALLWKFYQSL